jgi:hypothetical protein
MATGKEVRAAKRDDKIALNKLKVLKKTNKVNNRAQRKAEKVGNISRGQSRKDIRVKEGRGHKVAMKAIGSLDHLVSEAGSTLRDKNFGENIKAVGGLALGKV